MSDTSAPTGPATTWFAPPGLGEPELSWPKPERLEQGCPLRETWSAVAAPTGAAKQLSSGLWRCEPGRWRIEFGETQQEVFTVLSGRCRVHDAHGGFREVGPGESLHIPAGFRGSFEVLETVTKSWVILD
ncbi:cupin domain-containing protein [Curvibacter sp. RS43]|uniref:Cupin domain-containing protein n=1 Tax=Curvibacter microcysteis TaxID=3026419 RepID=A0ABT5MI63_9BURK|nr:MULTISPECIES: cupin domain-containing protein [unclassified Curvibacter]MDD0810588.1 cupin domain-containing protein [Curvibacter sp. RS43]MDD0815674.1 cupin domain-containing protein [Curvibacter sp. HBC28]